MTQLSVEQLNESLRRAKTGAALGGMLSAAGAIGIISGIITVSHVEEREDEGKAYTGVFLIGMSIPVEIAGLTLWGIHGSRVSSIKSTLKNPDLKVGWIHTQPPGSWGSSHESVMPVMTVTFSF